MQYTEILNFSPHVTKALYEDLKETQQRFSLDTLRRLRYFLAQTSYESGNYSKFVESMYYSTPAQIARTWPSRFWATDEKGNKVGHGPLQAALYAKSPEKLANEVYGGRMGNTEPGDGWKFIGHGAIQLTGKDNHTQCSLDLFGDLRLVEEPTLAATKYPFLTSGWFWSTNNLNALADKDEYTNVTSRITGERSATRLKSLVDLRLPYLRRANQYILSV